MSKRPQNSVKKGRKLPVKISIVVPCYNASTKIGRCVDSLDKMENDAADIEVIFVDDNSTDGTVDLIRRLCRTRDNWSIIELEVNSGSPSRPRNVGVSRAVGEYVFFLDADDELLPSALWDQYLYAQRWNADVVRGSLIVAETGKERRVTNTISDFADTDPKVTKISKILSEQSTTNSSLIKRRFLELTRISWPEDLHMGEDTVYLIDVLAKASFIGYVDRPVIVYNKFVSDSKSATQIYGGRELDSHLQVWTSAEASLTSLGLSYLSIRGNIAIRVAVEGLHRFYPGDISPDHLKRFSEFLSGNWDTISRMDFLPRVAETLRLAKENHYEDFIQDIKPRLVIAGADLKFIMEAIPQLRERFQIRIDKWTGHESHDARLSQELLDWAEIVWCEWLLGNAVWYAKRKRWNQKLVVRLHLFEMTRDFGHTLDVGKVDCFVCVSVPTAEDMIATFGYPRQKVRVIPNYIDADSYDRSSDSSRVFRLAMVGVLPARKGLLKALHLLKALRDVDSRYSLIIVGKKPEELPWVNNDPEERAYYDACAKYIRISNLSHYVEYSGWVDTRSYLSSHGFVLSLSDFESFHVAPAEAFAAGNQAVFLPWRGVEFIYPDEYIFDDIFAIRDYVLKNRALSDFDENAIRGEEYVRSMYSVERFVSLVHQMTVEI